jgi:hypothetical protein
MLLMKIIDDRCENYMKHINIMSGKNFCNVTAGFTNRTLCFANRQNPNPVYIFFIILLPVFEAEFI